MLSILSTLLHPAPLPHSPNMTVQGSSDQKADIVAKTQDEAEQVPTYQEAVAGSSSSAPAPANAGAGVTEGKGGGSAAVLGSTYPFPSASTQPNYGQSPYQANGTARIVIVQGGAQGLPFPATAVQRGPRAGRRFLIAFFWAIVLYLILGLVMGTVMEMEEGAHHPRTPPGWKHHHGNDDWEIK